MFSWCSSTHTDLNDCSPWSQWVFRGKRPRPLVNRLFRCTDLLSLSLSVQTGLQFAVPSFIQNVLVSVRMLREALYTNKVILNDNTQLSFRDSKTSKQNSRPQLLSRMHVRQVTGRAFDPRRARQHYFVEIDHKIFSIVFFSLPLTQEGELSVSGERMCTNPG